VSTVQVADALLTVMIFWALTTPHEFAHAWVAEKLGDDTPRQEGRVTLNPLAHVDWVGTVILPLATSLLAGAFLGWGRAVNTNPYKLRFGYNGLALVALAGPASNVVFALLIAAAGSVFTDALQPLFRAAYLSLYLAIFNMLPVPPLDGSKLLLALRLPAAVYTALAQYGFILLLVVAYSTGLLRGMSALAQQWAVSMFLWFRG
jgi:Zn-dependent protease